MRQKLPKKARPIRRLGHPSKNCADYEQYATRKRRNPIWQIRVNNYIKRPPVAVQRAQRSKQAAQHPKAAWIAHLLDDIPISLIGVHFNFNYLYV
jgi:hypothetical protein